MTCGTNVSNPNIKLVSTPNMEFLDRFGDTTSGTCGFHLEHLLEVMRW